MYAVKDRVPSVQKACNQAQKSGPQQSLDDLEMKEFLPTQEVQDKFAEDLKYIIPRIIVEYLPAYEPLSNDVVRHIPHDHSAEMATKSEVVIYILIPSFHDPICGGSIV